MNCSWATSDPSSRLHVKQTESPLTAMLVDRRRFDSCFEHNDHDSKTAPRLVRLRGICFSHASNAEKLGGSPTKRAVFHAVSTLTAANMRARNGPPTLQYFHRAGDENMVGPPELRHRFSRFRGVNHRLPATRLASQSDRCQ